VKRLPFGKKPKRIPFVLSREEVLKFLPRKQRMLLTTMYATGMRVAACRTATMGGHVQRCTACGTQTPLYNSCGNRHCPKCQAGDRAAWLEARRQELLPVEYFHTVFTVPHELAPVAAAHPTVFYNILFRAVRETLLQVAATPRHLGAQIGGLMVLHTWGQTLELHPQVHVIVPGGGLSPDGTRWIPCKPGFFLPVRVLSRWTISPSNAVPLYW
jgi:hypothetical protein